ncbi:ABC transporter ATP-binding protein [Polaromonas sp. JS666]|uniref:ABC transporter ATP-binding protein n=1 Tax=Polaromonas sp. (strain JS666 / ATCC BAA-500) TaxID=296591 RepID=UPI00005345AD|nr:ABC transporter ATP-binding protein [Polaromonas sp. JS666]ABE46306.1 ABC transporter related protein [Polaromonas sp. JS666]
MSFLSLRALSKTYGGDSHVVRELNLDVERGEFISLLGPSGCGKTTTLQMVAGFVVSTSGRVHLNGKDITEVRPEKRDMGLVFQSYALFPHMTVAENIGFGLEMRKLARPQAASRIEESLELVRLGGLGKRYPRELSGGQRQRVAIARALAIRPQVLLLDEPMSNLDAKLRGEMHVELRGLQRQLGITTILVTHDQVEAMTMSDRIAVMSEGKIAQLGTPFEVYDRPASGFASSFLGQTNVIPGRVTEMREHCAIVQAGPCTMRIPHAGTNISGEVGVYIRPERLRLAAAGQGNLPGKVTTRLFLGNHWLYEIESVLGTLRLTSTNLGDHLPGEGENIGLVWRDDDLRAIPSERAHG